MISQSLLQDYQNGTITGAIVDSSDLHPEITLKAKKARIEYLASNEPSLSFRERAGHLTHIDTKKGLALPFAYYMKLDDDALFGTQLIGDCYSWSTRAIIDITRINESIHNEQPSAYIESSATALIYGLRGHSSQGMTLYEVINACKQGGILLEKIYQANGREYDFRSYPSYYQIGNGWPRTRVPSDLLEQTRQYSIQEYAIIEDMDELDALLFSGRAASCGSSINPGTTATNGLVNLQRSPIAHAMAIIGVDKTREYFPYDIYVWDNSWGQFVRYNSHLPWLAKLGIRAPQGYFCLSRDDTWKGIRAKGTFAVSGISGFPELNLPKLTDLGTIGNIFG